MFRSQFTEKSGHKPSSYNVAPPPLKFQMLKFYCEIVTNYNDTYDTHLQVATANLGTGQWKKKINGKNDTAS